MAKKVKSFWGRLLAYLSSPFIQDKLLDLLEKKVIKMLLKKLVISGGIKAWLIGFVVGEILEEADEHLIEPAFRAVGFTGEVLDGAKIFKKVTNAEDLDQWLNAINDV